MDDIAAQLVLQALVKIKEGCEQKCVKSGIIDNISQTIFQVQKIRNEEPKTIGFFGAQKRGKSSIINQLLRCNLMPVSWIPTSSVVIKVKHDQNLEKGRFTIELFDSNGRRDHSDVDDLMKAQLILKEYGSRQGNLSSEVDTISVTSNFADSRILEHGGVLVDTPGAEIAFDAGESTKANSVDAQRAISILGSTHMVVFVERADQMQAKNSKIFFTKHLKKMAPLTVVNFKDVYSLEDCKDPLEAEKKKELSMLKIMLQTYSVDLARVLCVSSKEAAKARENNDDGLLEKSNVPKLEARIVDELHNLDRGLMITCLNELKKTLSQVDDKTTAKDIFMEAKRPFYVLLAMPDIGKEIKEIAGDIYEQYR